MPGLHRDLTRAGIFVVCMHSEIACEIRAAVALRAAWTSGRYDLAS
jgi:hypothetical protein